MKKENTPIERKRAAKSVYLRGLIKWELGKGMMADREGLKKEYGKWYDEV
jgi:hypothetical protein